jgi:ABC-type polysaccharide/polyol phosphate transport system ATPase subunit
MELCDRAVWLDHGEMMMCGKIEDVFDAYEGRKGIEARG